VNEDFSYNVDQQIARSLLQTWVVPDDRDPQDFKEDLLRRNFTEEQLAFREAYIHALGEWFAFNQDHIDRAR